MNNIKRKSVGKTNVAIADIGFGGASLGNLYRPISDAEVETTLQYCWDRDIRFFDTAPYYGFGLSEKRLGAFLSQQPRKEFSISTKVGRVLKSANPTSKMRYGFYSDEPFEPVYDYSYDGIMYSFEDSQKRLKLDYIDILLIHDIGQMTHGAEANTKLMKDAFGGGYKALDELRSSGAIGAFGLGVNETEICSLAMQHGRFDCFLLAGRYTLLEQAVDFMQSCQDYGASIIAGGIFNSGILVKSTKSTPREELYYNYKPASDYIFERTKQLEEISDEYGIPLAAAAIQFAMTHPAVVSTIPGLGSKNHVQKTFDLLSVNIPKEYWQELKSSGLVHSQAPTA